MYFKTLIYNPFQKIVIPKNNIDNNELSELPYNPALVDLGSGNYDSGILDQR